MRINNLGRTLAAIAITVGTVVAAPTLAGSSPVPQGDTQLPVVGADLVCDVGGQADFGINEHGVFSGIYAASYRHCFSPNGTASKYSSWLAYAPVTVTGCPQTKFTGSARLIWTNRDGVTVEYGTADYEISLDLLALRATLFIKITSGPLNGAEVHSVDAITTDAGTVDCGGTLPGIQRVFLDGGVEFRRP
ncbi:hypothetical protein NDR87_31130 [Nocardia sp. CDC159]|uniref:Secreted protein n=1 Tax=Nocardia pulmonis TaxID=2951408 RepID=A0A9X2ECR9_9NOCA|nr:MULTISPECIES: hypothetical protein [Nocardia]MCM6777995.1 hypothetical protein [Nocardia pulmonis]MCM6790834.1 hypothetical protein [Nocardia sp. CDC159]